MLRLSNRRRAVAVILTVGRRPRGWAAETNVDASKAEHGIEDS